MNPVDVDPWAPRVPTCLPNVPLSRRVLALAPDRGFTDTLAFALARSVSHRRVERPPHAAAYVLRFADSSGLWFWRLRDLRRPLAAGTGRHGGLL